MDLTSAEASNSVGPQTTHNHMPEEECHFARLPTELRNAIYQLLVVQDSPIRLPRRVHASHRANWHKDAGTSGILGLPAFGVPAIAKTNQLFRQECLDIFWTQNDFVFLLNCRNIDFEVESLDALENLIQIIGPNLKFMKAKSFEIRLFQQHSMRFLSLQRLAGCFGAMHMIGLRHAEKVRDRMLKPTTVTNNNRSVLFRQAMNHMFTLGRRLAKLRCQQPNTRHAPLLLDCKLHDHLSVEFRRFTQCRNGQAEGKFFFKKNVLKLMKDLGFDLPKNMKCPDGCCRLLGKR